MYTGDINIGRPNSHWPDRKLHARNVGPDVKGSKVFDIATTMGPNIVRLRSGVLNGPLAISTLVSTWGVSM